MQLKAFLALVFGAALGAFTIFFGPMAADALMAPLGIAEPPQYPAMETVYSLLIFGSLLAVALIGGALTGVKPLRLGDNRGKMAALGAALGLVGVAAATGYAAAAGSLVNGEGAPATIILLIWGTLVILFQTSVEEVYFRGWLQPVLASAWGVWPAVLATTLLFSLMHLLGQAQSLTSLLNLFLGGLLFGMLAARGHGLAGAIAAHFSWNWTERLILGLSPNPGTGSFDALIDLDLTGPAIWGGSEEGLNASAAMSFALIALLVPLLLLWTSRAPPSRSAASD